MKANLDDLYLYLRIVETGSLRAAAQDLGTDPSNVSRRLSGLEERLGARLIQRSRVRSQPTDAGRQYYERLKDLLEQFEAIEEEVNGAAEKPRGLLRVTAPIDFGVQHVGPWLHELTAQAPELSIDLIVGDHIVDMTEGGVDVAIRIGRLPDSALKARRLGSMRLALVCAPSYLDRRARPEQPDELSRHDFVLYSGLQAGVTLTLTHRQGERCEIRCRSRFSINNLGGVARLVEAGAGLHAGPLWYFAPALESGRLLRVLPDWSPPDYPVNALYQPTRYLPAKVRRFVDLAATRMRATAGIDP